MKGGEAYTDPHAHAATFYDHDHELVDGLARFVADGIDLGERAVVLATPEHRDALERELATLGLDPDEPPAAGNLVLLDARTTLGSVLVDGEIARDRVVALAGQLITDATVDGARVRIYGELVDLLWQDGHVAGALALETAWCSILDRVEFRLLCGYRASHLAAVGLVDVHETLALHSAVTVPPGYAETGTPAPPGLSQVFLPVPESVVASRRFVISAVERLGLPHVVHDAALVISELATNALLHARSPFRVTVDQSVGVVCLSVQDVGAGIAQPPAHPDETALDGRGMAIVGALARRWGCDSLVTGKVVWAELSA